MIMYKTKIQQEVYSKSWCFAQSMLSCLPSRDLCKLCERPVQEFFSWSTLHAWIFFRLIFLAWCFFFWYFAHSPASHNFSNGPSLNSSLWDFINVHKLCWHSINDNPLLSITQEAYYPVDKTWINVVLSQLATSASVFSQLNQWYWHLIMAIVVL